MSSLMTRRRLLGSFGIFALLAPVLQACAQATSTPAPAAPQPTSASKQEAEPKPSSVPSSQAAASQGQARLSVALQIGTDTNWQVNAAKAFAQQHPEISLQIDQVPNDDMAKKQLAGIATGTLQDVVFSGIKYMHYSAYKGAFKALDDFVKTKDPGLDDFFAGAIAGCRLDGELYALPIEVNTGNQNIVIFNKTLLEEKGVEAPTDEWTVDDFANGAAAVTDEANNIYGTNYLTTNYYDFATLVRSYGGDILDAEGKKFTFATDPMSVEAARWKVDLRTKHNAAPRRAEAQGLQFAAGQIGFNTTGIYAVRGLEQTIGDKFEWDVVLGPKGPTGLRGYEFFVVMYSMYAKTKYPDQAYDLLVHLTSKETLMTGFLEEGNPSPRKSIWLSPEAEKIHTIWRRAAEWLSDDKNRGPFPMPYNLRFSELQDKFGNLVEALWYGEVEFDEGLQKIQEECQKIVDLPRG